MCGDSLQHMHWLSVFIWIKLRQMMGVGDYMVSEIVRYVISTIDLKLRTMATVRSCFILARSHYVINFNQKLRASRRQRTCVLGSKRLFQGLHVHALLMIPCWQKWGSCILLPWFHNANWREVTWRRENIHNSYQLYNPLTTIGQLD